MVDSKLSPLQRRLLEILAGIEPRWSLTGGGALAGFHLGHRATRDLDLFWHGRSQLGDLRELVLERLAAAGLGVSGVERADSFMRLRVTDGVEEVLLDLVAEPVPFIEPPVRVRSGTVEIQVDGMHEILVNKLCALLSRSELRDLIDLRALLAAGGDLERACLDATRKDGGFSPLVLQWLLRGFPVAQLAAKLGHPPHEAEELSGFRDRVVEELARSTRPEA